MSRAKNMIGDDTPQPGDAFGGVTLVRIIGSGGFGDVWLAVDGVGLHVAIKLISKRLGQRSAAEREHKAAKLLRESATNHTNIVSMHHIGSTDDYFFYTMDLADPQEQSVPASSERYLPTTLQSLLASGVPVSPDDAVDIAKSLLAGLAHLHELKIIHRDIKPANVLRVGGSWKIADFGVATSDRTELTTVGTLGYLAPNGKPGSSGDLFAVGKILYCLVTGNPVEDFPSLGTLADIPLDRIRRFRLIQVVNKACAQDPADRYTSAEDFLRDLIRAADVERIRRSRRLKMYCVAAAIAVASIGLGYWASLPKPIGVGDFLSTTTIEAENKPGNDVVTFVVTHNKVWKISDGGNGHRYLALLRMQDVSQWGLAEAAVIAKQLGGYVVAVETPEENAWLFNEIVQDPRLWSHFIRRAHDDFFNDPVARLPKLSVDEELFFKEYRGVINGADQPDYVPIPATNGPMIGIWVSKDGRSLEWFDGSPVELGSWASFEPYYSDGTYLIAFGYANMQGRIPISTWVRRSCNNNLVETIPNVTTSFIVEIPR